MPKPIKLRVVEANGRLLLCSTEHSTTDRAICKAGLIGGDLVELHPAGVAERHEAELVALRERIAARWDTQATHCDLMAEQTCKRVGTRRADMARAAVARETAAFIRTIPLRAPNDAHTNTSENEAHDGT